MSRWQVKERSLLDICCFSRHIFLVLFWWSSIVFPKGVSFDAEWAKLEDPPCEAWSYPPWNASNVPPTVALEAQAAWQSCVDQLQEYIESCGCFDIWWCWVMSQRGWCSWILVCWMYSRITCYIYCTYIYICVHQLLTAVYAYIHSTDVLVFAVCISGSCISDFLTVLHQKAQLQG